LDALKQREKDVGDVQLVGFAEINGQQRAAIETEYGIPGYVSHGELIDKAKPDALTIVTPDHLHYQVIMDALDADKALLVEKPLTTDVAEAKAIVQKVREKELLLQVDFHKRFDPYHLDLKMRIEAGELGKVEYGYCWMEDVLRVGTTMIGQQSWGNHGSPAWFLGIHMIDLTYWLMGCPKPTKVYATGIKGKLQSMGIDIYDAVKAQVTYDNGAVITYDTSAILPDSHESIVRQGVKIIGTEGFMEVNSQYRGARGCTTNKGMEAPNLGALYRTYDKSGRIVTHGYLHDSIYDFIASIRHLRNAGTLYELEGKYASAEQGLVSTAIGAAIHTSAETGELCVIQNF
jgi:predicted dehydrogenase